MNIFFKRLKWIDSPTCWIKTNWFQHALTKLPVFVHKKYPQNSYQGRKKNGQFIFIGMKAIQIGCFKVETSLTEAFLPKSHEDLVPLQLQLN